MNHYTYQATWSAEDGEFIGACAEFPSLSWLAPSPDEAFAGIRRLRGGHAPRERTVAGGGWGTRDRAANRERRLGAYRISTHRRAARLSPL